MTVKDALARFPALRDLSSSARERVERTSTVRRFDEGAVLSEPGGECRAFPLIAEGEIRIEALSEDGRSALLYEVTGGQTCIMTASCLLSGQRFPVRATVSRPTTAILVPPSEFATLFATEEAMRRLVVETLSARLAAVMALVDAVLFTRLDVRIARWLAERQVIEATHEDLATRFATARQVVSRTLGGFQERGWIVQSRGRIEITNADALRAWGAEP